MARVFDQYNSETPKDASREERYFPLAWRYIQSVRSHSIRLTDNERHSFACSIVASVISNYWYSLQLGVESAWDITPCPSTVEIKDLNGYLRELTFELGRMLVEFEPISAGYIIGELYTSLLPDELRSQHGIYYTPPALSSRLIYLVSKAGVDWAHCRVLDPACGGGAFLTPVALEMVSARGSDSPREIIQHIQSSLYGIEIDEFGGWMSQVLLESALLDLCRLAGVRLAPLVKICNSLTEEFRSEKYDLIIGNPPYGRVKLPDELRIKYKRSLHGHANIYGLFMDFAVRSARDGGVIAYITPTGFLGGEYFKALRSIMSNEAPPISVDLVVSRKGVFSDVLQETLLATYRRASQPIEADVNILSIVDEQTVLISSAGTFILPEEPTNPWLLPRSRELAMLVTRLRTMPHRLQDYGYEVSTGPLVWNRHKSQLHDTYRVGRYPIVWAESVTSDGKFFYRTDKKNHKPFLELQDGDEWLVVDRPCVLVQRTTAKEQKRRLIAAELPYELLDKHGFVSVENHLNMVRASSTKPMIPAKVMAALLNSEIVDSAFRCINGSVAVSAYELEALPLPAPENLIPLLKLIEEHAPDSEIERFIRTLYIGDELYAHA